jgi:hypothetical protein
MRSASHPAPRWLARIVLGVFLATGLAALSSAAWALPCTTVPTVVRTQPVDGGALKVARIAGGHAGQPDTWDMRYDVWFCNPNAGALTISTVKIEHLNGAAVASSVVIPAVTPEPSAPTARVWPITVAAKSTDNLVMVRDDTQYAFPLPTSIRVTFTFTSGPDVQQTYTVAEHVDPGPLKGFFFPFRQADLPADSYWSQGRHAEDNTFQRYAYDLGVVKWDGSNWVALDAGKDATLNASYYSFDKPVYAMSDGILIGCNRGAPDNASRPPVMQVGNVPGGNVLWVRTGNETQLYAHLKHNSVPYSLCPFTDDQEHKLADPTPGVTPDPAYVIHAGQLLGHTGATGWSQGGTHLHVHTYMGLPKIWGGSESGIDADARPLEFVNVRVQELVSGSKADSAKWSQITSAKLLPYNTLIEGNDCGYYPNSAAGKAEVLNTATAGNCFLEMANAMFQEGDRPTSIDVYGLGSTSQSTTVWRPGGGVANIFLAGLDDAGLDAARQTWVVNNGFRVRQIEAYVEGGVLKHAVIFEKGTPGGAQILRRDIDNATMAQLGNQNPGYVPVNLSVAVVNGVARYDALMEKKSVGSLIVNVAVPIADLPNQLQAQKNAGRYLAYLDGFEQGGSTFVSAIWYGNLPATTTLPDQTAPQLQSAEGTNVAAGRLMQGVTQYKVGNKIMYAGFWR